MNERFSPETEQQALELIQWAVAENRTIAIRGGNTKQGFGFQVEADCSVSMEKLAGILEYHPEELVMSALPRNAAGTGTAGIRTTSPTSRL